MRPAHIRINEHVAHYLKKLDTPVLGPLRTTKRKWTTQCALSLSQTEKGIWWQRRHQKKNDCKKIIETFRPWNIQNGKYGGRTKKRKEKLILWNVFVLWPYERGARMLIMLGKQHNDEKYTIKIVYREILCQKGLNFKSSFSVKMIVEQ